jgi:transposase
MPGSPFEAMPIQSISRALSSPITERPSDSVYNGSNLHEALAKFGKWTIEIVKRAADAAGFHLLPRRWVVERTLAWLNRNRRLAKDFEASIAAKAWVYVASV